MAGFFDREGLDLIAKRQQARFLEQANFRVAD
jgi:hypothetical protein